MRTLAGWTFGGATFVCGLVSADLLSRYLELEYFWTCAIAYGTGVLWLAAMIQLSKDMP